MRRGNAVRHGHRQRVGPVRRLCAAAVKLDRLGQRAEREPERHHHHPG
jgi:hypothetical protein